MKLILARLLWTFDMILPGEHREWGENLDIYHLKFHSYPQRNESIAIVPTRENAPSDVDYASSIHNLF